MLLFRRMMAIVSNGFFSPLYIMHKLQLNVVRCMMNLSKGLFISILHWDSLRISRIHRKRNGQLTINDEK